MADSSSADGTPLQRFERQLLENYPFLAVLMTVLLAAPYARIYEGDPRRWDWLLISGILVFLVTYPLSLLLPDRVAKALQELQGRGVLRPEEAISAFRYRLSSLANRWASVGGPVLAGVMCIAWLAAAFVGVQLGKDTFGRTVPGMLVEMALSIPAGRFIGRGLCYGTLAGRLRAEGITLRPIPNHPDGVAGLSPVGGIYLAHAILIAPIIIFLSVWVILLPYADPQYASWRLPYVGLLILMLALEVVTLLRPLRAFNRVLLEWKQEMLGDPSVTGVRMSELQQRFLQERRDQIEQMPTWVLNRAAGWFLAGVLATPLLFIVAGLILAQQ